MKESLSDKILAQFQSRYRHGNEQAVHSQKLGDWGHALGYKHETVGRCLRILAEQGKLEPLYHTMKKTRGKTVSYKYIPTERDRMVQSLHESNGN